MRNSQTGAGGRSNGQAGQSRESKAGKGSGPKVQGRQELPKTGKAGSKGGSKGKAALSQRPQEPETSKDDESKAQGQQRPRPGRGGEAKIDLPQPSPPSAGAIPLPIFMAAGPAPTTADAAGSNALSAFDALVHGQLPVHAQQTGAGGTAATQGDVSVAHRADELMTQRFFPSAAEASGATSGFRQVAVESLFLAPQAERDN